MTLPAGDVDRVDDTVSGAFRPPSVRADLNDHAAPALLAEARRLEPHRRRSRRRIVDAVDDPTPGERVVPASVTGVLTECRSVL
ncbi:hypothetical protein ACETU7_06830 [Rhodococcus sp. 3Y1]